MFFRQFGAALLERLDTLPVDELHGPACPARKADAEDAADVRLVHAGQHAFSEAARGFHGLAVEQAVLDVLGAPFGAGFLEQGLQLRP